MKVCTTQKTHQQYLSVQNELLTIMKDVRLSDYNPNLYYDQILDRLYIGKCIYCAKNWVVTCNFKMVGWIWDELEGKICRSGKMCRECYDKDL